MKATFHKACSCRQCKAGRRTKFGHYIVKANERRLRHTAKQMLAAVVRGAEDALIGPISSPLTD